MTTPGSHRLWDGSEWVTTSVPMSGSENVMIPVLRVVVVDETGDAILLQRRVGDVASVRGLIEIPGGRWRSGESPIACAKREIREETGIDLRRVDGVDIARIDDNRSIASIRPLVVIAGVDGGFPAVHTVLVGSGTGEITPEAGATTEVRWWSLSEVRAEMATNPAGFIPSSFAALSAYAEMVDSGI